MGRPCGPAPASSCADGDRAPLSPSASSASSRDDGRSCTPRPPAGLATSASRQRKLYMQPVETSHNLQVARRHRTWQIVNAATADAQNLRLLCDRQSVLTVDHRFALSNPALLSAPSKKSFSSVSSPILACSDFTSTAGCAAAWPPPGPNTSAAPLSSCAFHDV